MLKDILLVIASIVVFGDPVSGLQFFGYSIALCGLIYYKLGADKIKEYLGDGQRAWADYGVRHPALRKLIVFGLVIFTVFIIFGGLGNAFPEYDPSQMAREKLGNMMGSTGDGA